MQDIYQTDLQSHQHSISSMVLSYTGVPRICFKPQEEVQIQKQEQIHRSVRSKLDQKII